MFESPSKKIYIGQTVDFVNRYKQYKRNKEAMGRVFTNAITKYKGIDNFNLTILHTIDLTGDRKKDKEELDKLEIEYIEKFNSSELGYNVTKGGGGSLGREVTPETRKLLSIASKKQVRKEAEKVDVICHQCKRVFSKLARYHRGDIKDGQTNFYCSKSCSLIGLKENNPVIARANKLSIEEEQVIVETYNRLKNITWTVNEVKHDKNTIKRVLKSNNITIVKPKQNYTNSCMNKPLKVNQYDLDMNFIKTHDSLSNAARELGKDRRSCSQISKCCKNKSAHAFGYKWQYAK